MTFIVNHHFDGLTDEELAQVHELVQHFEDAWLRAERPVLDDYLPDEVKLRRAAFLELVHTALEFQIKAGETTALGAYLERFPELADDHAAVLELAAVEYELRRRAPETAPTSPGSSGFEVPAARPADAGGTPVLRLLNRYELLRPLGTGACGTVYLARDAELDRLVAVKLPRLGRLAGPDEVSRFVREARSTAQFRHPGIVPVHDAGQVDGLCYLVSAYIPGTTLGQRLATGRLAPDDAARLVRQVAEALDCAHRHGVVHRDIKPSNILLDCHGRPHLADFGLARRTTGEHTLTAAGQVLGTPAYMSPEQARGEAHRVDGRSDIYSLGVILYQALTGRVPFDGALAQVLRRVLDEEPTPPRRREPRIPRDLETVCLKALAKDPGGRYPTARALADDLARFLHGQPVEARPVGRLARLVRWCRRQPVAAGLVAALVLGIGGTSWQGYRAGFLFREAEQSRDEAQQAVAEFAHLSLHDVNYENVRLDHGRVDLVVRALKYLEDAPGAWSHDPALRGDAARAFYLLARFYGSDPTARDQTTAAYEKSLTLLNQLIREDPGRKSYRDLHAEVGLFFGEYLALNGQDDRAFSMLQAATAWLADAPSKEWREPINRCHLAQGYIGLGFMACDRGRPEETLTWCRKGLAIADQLAEAAPADARYVSTRGQGLFHLARAHTRLGHTAEALRRYQESAAVWEGLAANHPDMPRYRQDLAACYHSLANLHRDAGQLPDAVRLYRQALALRQALCTEKSDDLKYRSDRDGTQRNLSQVLDRLSQATPGNLLSTP